MSVDIDQFSYISKLMGLIDRYVELSLPLPAALRAAEADLSTWRSDSSWRVSEVLTESDHCGDWKTASPPPRS